MAREINEIIVHCTGNKRNSTITARDIDRLHRYERGWQGIGYHYLILPDGTIEQGRPLTLPGAHCKGHNAESVGIAYVGGLGDDGRPANTLTEEQKLSLRTLIAALCTLLPIRQLAGHRDYANKACPCFNVRKWWEDTYGCSFSEWLKQCRTYDVRTPSMEHEWY